MTYGGITDMRSLESWDLDETQHEAVNCDTNHECEESVRMGIERGHEEVLAGRVVGLYEALGELDAKFEI
jgi:hypothetical protein